MKNNKSLFKNTIIIGIGTICTKCLSFIMIPLYTMWLTPEAYGDFDLINSYLSLMIPIITLQLEQAIFRFSLKNEKDSLQYFYNAFLVTLINILIVDVISYFVLKNSTFRISFMLYFDSYAIFVLLIEYLRGNNKLKNYSFYNILSSVLIVCFNFLFVPILKFGANGLMYSFALSYFITILIIIIKEKVFISFKKNRISKNKIKEMLKYSIPMIPNGISWWITNVSDRTIIKLFIGNFYNGIYAVSCKIPTIMSLIYSIFNLSWQQTAILTYEDNDRNNYYNKVFKKLISFLFCSSFIILVFLPFLFKHFIAKEYATSFDNVPLLLLGSVYLCLGQFLGGILLAESNTKKIGYTTTIAAIINMVMNLVFMKKYGIIIAGISTLVSYIYFFFRRYSMLPVIHNKKTLIYIGVYTGIFFILYLIIFKTYQIGILSLLAIIIMIFSIYMNKELIRTILQKITKKLKKV